MLFRHSDLGQSLHPGAQLTLMQSTEPIGNRVKQTTTATATGTSPNKRFNEQNKNCARAL